MGSTKSAKYGSDGISGGGPRGGVIYRYCDFFSFFFFLGIAPRPYRVTDFRAKTLKRRGMAQGGAFWGSELKIFEIWGCFTPKSAQKGAWLGIFTANKSIEYIDAIFACIDRLSPNYTGKCRKATYTW